MDNSNLIEGQKKEGQKIKLLVNRSSFLLLNKTNTIYTFKDISVPLENKEIESWQKLIRILAHEIINSLTPITSLTDTNLMIMKKMNPSETLNTLQMSMNTIKERSENLLDFMEGYRKLVKIPKPEPCTIDIKDLQNTIFTLFTSDMKDITVVFNNSTETIWADKILLEQTLVNLITNSIQAMQATKERSIEWNTYSHDHVDVIEIVDSGKGIDNDTLEKVFIPFYTTKESGSGIGLSLAQQIMKMHDGNISILSEPEHRTVVKLVFPKQAINEFSQTT
jgi:nitrogen fixation/metabolism regulation signal transduction histidine kinase